MLQPTLQPLVQIQPCPVENLHELIYETNSLHNLLNFMHSLTQKSVNAYLHMIYDEKRIRLHSPKRDVCRSLNVSLSLFIDAKKKCMHLCLSCVCKYEGCFTRKPLSSNNDGLFLLRLKKRPRDYLQVLISKPPLKFNLCAAEITAGIQQVKCIQGIYHRKASNNLSNMLLVVVASIQCCGYASNRRHAINLLVSQYR